MNLKKWIGVELVEVGLLEKAVATFGSALAIFAVFYVTNHSLPAAAAVGVVGSMGATAVLLFAVPHGPLSQPWPVWGGHTVAALIGVTCAQNISNPSFATAMAVGLAIGAMYQLRCIHPPGGATAFVAVMGGDAIHEIGYAYVLYPVWLNTFVMFALAVVVNYPFAWRRYPAALIRRNRTSAKPSEKASHAEISRAIESLGSFVDISEEDLVYLIESIKKNGEASELCVTRKGEVDRWLVSDHADERKPYDQSVNAR